MVGMYETGQNDSFYSYFAPFRNDTALVYRGTHYILGSHTIIHYVCSLKEGPCNIVLPCPYRPQGQYRTLYDGGRW